MIKDFDDKYEFGLNNFASWYSNYISTLNKFIKVDGSYWADMNCIELELKIVDKGKEILSRFISFEVEKPNWTLLQVLMNERVLDTIELLIDDLEEEKNNTNDKKYRKKCNNIISSLKHFKFNKEEN